MIKIENVAVWGWETAIRGMRNPMNSWDKSDTKWVDAQSDFDEDDVPVLIASHWEIGPNDYKLMMNLCKGGTEESKWRRMIHVTFDVTAPLYWWKEADTYKVGTVANSCSTMHKIAEREFTLDDFSHEHLMDKPMPDVFQVKSPHDILYSTIDMLNLCRNKYLETKDKSYWWQMIQLLPSSYNQRRTVDLNYEVLAAQYRQRKNHKLTEWVKYCEWIRSLPYSEFITGEM